MKISELFFSIQGEGELTGIPSVFVERLGAILGAVGVIPSIRLKPEGENVDIEELWKESQLS